MTAARPAVFLDRDGVLNAPVVRDGRPYPPARAEELVLLPGVQDACRRLRDAGLPLIVVTNQPDVARGTADRAEVERINARLSGDLGVTEVVTCPHDDADGCGCRKPLPGMLVDAAARHGLDLARSVMVGDRWRDVEAGRAAGAMTVFVDRGYAERAPAEPDLTVRELEEAVPWIIRVTASPRSTAVAR